MTADLDTIPVCVDIVYRWAKKHADEHRMAPNLAGLCAIASARLFKLLTKRGVQNIKLCVNDYHCFIMQGNTIIDVTAGQFIIRQDALFSQYMDNRGVVIGPMPNVPPRYWEPVAQFTTVKDLVAHQVNEGWWEHQIPRP